MKTIAHMHNVDGSDWNAEILATRAEVLAAKETMLDIHCHMHDVKFGVERPPSGWPSGWRGCSPQVCARWIIEHHPDRFAGAIVEALLRAEAAGCHPLMQFLYAMVLPRRKRKKGLKGVFFQETRG